MISEECLARLQHNPVDFLRRFITVDETWIHHYSPETKQQSKQWTAKGEPVPKKAKTLRSAGKVSIGMLRKMISEECLARLQHNPVDFLRRFITVDETWIHHYSPEIKQQSKQWTAKREPVPKKAKSVRSAGKVMASIFWDAKGILFIDYLEKGKTINGPYYASLLDQLKQKIQEKRPS
ncbi:Mariner Mos1 transposase-like Protein [Tribolium castaneum]|uniref:Mariner Mos1 transposase-like Protein n=1 Tax=Tribolium castaneum TaxID=7070 RepID=A0A139WI38_TRICA|nr:Mariner Mos1 transposase-like Protein [Tribolium castaneum]